MGYVSEFSPDGRLFALLDSDGKLKIWDTKDSQLTREYVPNLHLSVPCTCFVWVTAAAKTVRKNQRRADTTLQYIALGTSKGGVDLFSYATGKVESKLQGSGHAGAVTFISLHNDSTLYTSGEDCRIVEWSLRECCENDAWSIGTFIPTCIVSLPISNSLLVGCKELNLWSLDHKNHKLKSTFTGHSADVKSMKMLQFTERNEEYVVSTAKSNREIYLWKIGAKKNPKGTFLMEYAATFVSCSIVGDGIMIAAVTGADRTAAGGVVHLFIVDDISDIGKKRMNPKVTIAVAFDSGIARGIVPIPIMAATSNFSNPQNILIGYGSSPTLRFEDIKYNPNEKKQTLQREDPRTVQINRKDKSKEHYKTIVPITNDKNTQYHTGSIGVLKSKSERKTSLLSSEISLDDRLKTLTVGDDDAKGNSLVELLKQALHNRDAVLLRTVFFNKDENVIRSTLKRLPAQFIPSLVDELTQLTQKKTANVQIAVHWLKLLLQIHASQLMALGKNELLDRFGALLGIIEHRTHALVPLTKLSGRLDFLMNQIKRNTDDDPTFNHESLLVIEDDASDNDDEDDDAASVNGDANSTDEDDFDMRNGDSSEVEESDDDMDES